MSNKIWYGITIVDKQLSAHRKLMEKDLTRELATHLDAHHVCHALKNMMSNEIQS
jgi:hypothetical protein